MFCTNCGKQMVEGARFCSYCGMKIVDFDENQAETAGTGTDNPVSVGENSVFNTENVENSGNLLKTTETLPNYVPKMNELPKSGYSPDSVPAAQDSPITPVSSISPNAEAVSDGALSASTDDIGGTLSSAVSPTTPVSSTSTNGEAASDGAPGALTDDIGRTLSSAVSPTTPVSSTSTNGEAASDGALSAMTDDIGRTLPNADSIIPPTSSISTNAVPIYADKANAPERRYTLAHLVMCLASTAVMAIAAGIFAGLYFSVV